MVKFRCCRFHNLFVFFLVLCAFSLVNHYLADAAAFATGTAPCQGQPSAANYAANADAVQDANLHGGFLPNEVNNSSILPTLWIRVDHTGPEALPWKPLALVRPPIFS